MKSDFERHVDGCPKCLTGAQCDALGATVNAYVASAHSGLLSFAGNLRVYAFRHPQDRKDLPPKLRLVFTDGLASGVGGDRYITHEEAHAIVIAENKLWHGED